MIFFVGNILLHEKVTSMTQTTTARPSLLAAETELQSLSYRCMQEKYFQPLTKCCKNGKSTKPSCDWLETIHAKNTSRWSLAGYPTITFTPDLHEPRRRYIVSHSFIIFDSRKLYEKKKRIIYHFNCIICLSICTALS